MAAITDHRYVLANANRAEQHGVARQVRERVRQADHSNVRSWEVQRGTECRVCVRVDEYLVTEDETVALVDFVEAACCASAQPAKQGVKCIRAVCDDRRKRVIIVVVKIRWIRIEAVRCRQNRTAVDKRTCTVKCNATRLIVQHKNLNNAVPLGVVAILF